MLLEALSMLPEGMVWKGMAAAVDLRGGAGGDGAGDPKLLNHTQGDHSLSKEVLNLVWEGARLLYAGKTARHHSHTQASENDRLFHVQIKIRVL
jgi:hypothetical protein